MALEWQSRPGESRCDSWKAWSGCRKLWPGCTAVMRYQVFDKSLYKCLYKCCGSSGFAIWLWHCTYLNPVGEEESVDRIFACDVVVRGQNLYARNTGFKACLVKLRSAGPNWECAYFCIIIVSALRASYLLNRDKQEGQSSLGISQGRWPCSPHLALFVISHSSLHLQSKKPKFIKVSKPP